jgi:alkylated DNA repair dioxygenase AlkB
MATRSLPPPGFHYRADFLSAEEEAGLFPAIARLPFEEFRFQQFTAKRKIVSYGFHYSFESYKLSPAGPIPAFLEPFRARAAAWIGCAPEDFAEALVTEYPEGAAIGWHKDVKPFERIVGISLGGACKMRFRKGAPRAQESFVVLLEPRSAYEISEEARQEWEHHIAVTPERRYSITFRTLRPEWKKQATRSSVKKF